MFSDVLSARNSLSGIIIRKTCEALVPVGFGRRHASSSLPPSTLGLFWEVDHLHSPECCKMNSLPLRLLMYMSPSLDQIFQTTEWGAFDAPHKIERPDYFSTIGY